ncbi:MAG: YjbQ family protein [Spirochaetales bacterium]|nr:YjbQ family protein [Spirochaetales bacterium]
MVFGKTVTVETRGYSDVHDLTPAVRDVVRQSGIRDGLVSVTSVGSTASISTIEFEPALVEDLKELLERLAPASMHSRHSATWGDDNGFSHLRATLMGPGTTLPVVEGEILLGTWQQVVLIDHDNRPRSRRVRIQVVG